MKNFLIAICSILLLTQCAKDITSENPYANCPFGKNLVSMTDPSVKSGCLIPLSLSNYWIYSDSIWQDDILQPLRQDTLRVLSAEKTGEDIWWTMSDGYRLCNGNDTVYKMNFNGFTPSGSLACPEKVLLFFQIDADTTVQWIEWTSDYGITGEIKLKQSSISTGAGDFRDSFEYNQSSTFGENIRWIKPGIGIIKTTQTNSYNNTRVIRTLVSYKTL